MQRRPGFTLTELIVVLVILGILATYGISQYIPARERGLGREARASLKLVAAAEKIYRMRWGSYYASTGAGSQEHIQNLNTYLKLSLNAGALRSWDYVVDPGITGIKKSFKAKADRIGEGGYLYCQYAIDQSQDDPIVVIGPCP